MLQYEVSMPSFRINGFAVNKDPREKQKRKREERRKAPLPHLGPGASSEDRKAHGSLLGRASASIRNKRGLHACRPGAKTAMPPRAPKQPWCSTTTPTATAGPREQREGHGWMEPWMEPTPLILLSLQRRGGGPGVSPRLQTSCLHPIPEPGDHQEQPSPYQSTGAARLLLAQREAGDSLEENPKILHLSAMLELLVRPLVMGTNHTERRKQSKGDSSVVTSPAPLPRPSIQLKGAKEPKPHAPSLWRRGGTSELGLPCHSSSWCCRAR